MKVPKELMDEICNAYFDAANPEHAETYTRRKLQFRAAQTLTLGQLATVLPKAIPTGYNEFDAEVVINVLRECKGKFLFTVAREGSPALYVHGSPADLANIMAMKGRMRADECSMWKDGTLRLWWD